MTELPETLGNCSRLKVLRCSHNYLTELPESIGNCIQLEELLCDENPLTHLPESLKQMDSLRLEVNGAGLYYLSLASSPPVMK